MYVLTLGVRDVAVEQPIVRAWVLLTSILGIERLVWVHEIVVVAAKIFGFVCLVPSVQTQQERRARTSQEVVAYRLSRRQLSQSLSAAPFGRDYSCAFAER